MHLAVDDHAAVAVRGVLAEAHVGHEHELREPGAQRAERLLDDPVVVPRPGRLLVLLGGDAEEDDGLHARADELLDLADDGVDRVARHPGQLLVPERLGRDEERHHELVEAQVRLADEAAEAAAAAEAAQADVGVAGHSPKEYVGKAATRLQCTRLLMARARRLMLSLASPQRTAPMPRSQAVCSASVRHGLAS